MLSSPGWASTYLGGSGNEEARAVAVDARGNAYLGGETFSTDFPVASATVQPAYGGGSYDGFVTKVSIEPPPVLRLSAAKLAFADQGIGTTSAPQTITLKNVGEALVALGKPSISGDFTVANECGTTLAPGSDCALEVTFAPAVPGARTGELTIPSDADGAPHAVELAGNGIGPAMDLSASAIVFEGMVVGATSAPRAVTLANSGNAPLSLSGIATSGDFAEANNCESGLPAGASCTIHITFAPTTAGTRSGALTVTNSFPHDVQAVSLSGIGQDFSVSASPDKAEIAAGKSGSYTLTVVPAGGFAKTVALACSGAPRAASCAVLPSSLILDGTNAAQATVTFETAAGGAAAPEEGSRPGSMRPHRKLPPYWLVLAALLFAFSAASGARRRLRWARAGVAVATLTVLLWSACGGGGGVPPAPPPPAGTPAGTYTLTLTGTYGSLTHSVNVAVTVK
ncbi:MAG: choice-of-anchor D domain-containing protein [Acidobacteriia bacterium]|nr:choice-of-anchor D domain-containing protein [Terriglobia bacterium]